MATYWENSCSFGLRYVSWYKYLFVSLVFSHIGFWSGNLFLIAPFPDLCLLVPFYFTDPSASFFHDAFLCRILKFNDAFDAYKRCLSYCLSCSVDKCAFTKRFGYIFQYIHPPDCVICLSLRSRQRKIKGF